VVSVTATMTKSNVLTILGHLQPAPEIRVRPALMQSTTAQPVRVPAPAFYDARRNLPDTSSALGDANVF